MMMRRMRARAARKALKAAQLPPSDDYSYSMRFRHHHNNKSAKGTEAQLRARAEKAERLRGLHAEYAARVHAQALVIREAAAALMRFENEIADRKDELLDGESASGFEPVGFEPYGDLEEQKETLDWPVCPGFADVHETMEELVKHCARVLSATTTQAVQEEKEKEEARVEATAGAP